MILKYVVPRLVRIGVKFKDFFPKVHVITSASEAIQYRILSNKATYWIASLALAMTAKLP